MTKTEQSGSTPISQAEPAPTDQVTDDGHGPGTDDLDSLPPSDFVSFAADDVEQEDTQ